MKTYFCEFIQRALQYIASYSDDIIREGMALSIDIPLFHAAWGGFRIGDGFSISRGKAQPRFPDYQNLVPLLL
jgi:hypothetical protein